MTRVVLLAFLLLLGSLTVLDAQSEEICSDFNDAWQEVVHPGLSEECSYGAIQLESTQSAYSAFCSDCGEASAWSKFKALTSNSQFRNLNVSCNVGDKPAVDLMDEFFGVCLNSEFESAHYCHPNVVELLGVLQNPPSSSDAPPTKEEGGDGDMSVLPEEGDGGVPAQEDMTSEDRVAEIGGSNDAPTRRLVEKSSPKHPFPGRGTSAQMICNPKCGMEAAALVRLAYPEFGRAPPVDGAGAEEALPTPVGVGGEEEAVSSAGEAGEEVGEESPTRREGDSVEAAGGDDAGADDAGGTGGALGQEEEVVGGGLGNEADGEEGGGGEVRGPEPREGWPDVGVDAEAYMAQLRIVKDYCRHIGPLPDEEEEEEKGAAQEGGGAEDQDSTGVPQQNPGGEEEEDSPPLPVETVTVLVATTLQLTEAEFDEAARTQYKAVVAQAFNVPASRVRILRVESLAERRRRALLQGGGVLVETEVDIEKKVEDPTANPIGTEAQVAAIQTQVDAQLQQLGLKDEWGMAVAEMEWKEESVIDADGDSPAAAPSRRSGGASFAEGLLLVSVVGLAVAALP